VNPDAAGGYQVGGLLRACVFGGSNSAYLPAYVKGIYLQETCGEI